MGIINTNSACVQVPLSTFSTVIRLSQSSHMLLAFLHPFFFSPTANNIMVMVELSGSGAQEGMARCIGWQYACAPLILSITVMLVVRVACS